MRGRFLRVIILLALFFITTILCAQEDVKGSKDHPVISRFPGSYIYYYDQKDFDQFYLLVGPVKSYSAAHVEEIKKEELEGKVTIIQYQTPKHKSVFEIFKNYERALKEAGFKLLYTGMGKDIEAIKSFHYYNNRFWDIFATRDDPGNYFHISAKNLRGDIAISVTILPSFDGPRVFLAVVEKAQLETGFITAKDMLREIEEKGHVAIYGIYFDFDKADIKPESQPVIEEIAKLLTENPQLKVYIVGHTDNVGDLEYNLDLSRRRAEAVVKELTTKYGIERSRLIPFGVGPLAPVASNDTEEGRAKNRRVEIVKQ